MSQLTPNSMSTTGRPIDQAALDAMSTEEMLAYYCELRTFADIYAAECERVKEAAMPKADLPQKYAHPLAQFGSCSQTMAGGKTIISVPGVVKAIGEKLTLQAASITQENLKKVTTTAQRAEMEKDGTITKVPGSVTLKFSKGA